MQRVLKVLPHEATCRSDTSPQQVASCDMYVFMQFDAATCRMNSNQFEFMQQVAATKCCTHIPSPRVLDMHLQHVAATSL